MHPLFPKASKLTEPVIGAAIEVHRDKGPGLIESIYEWCMMRELELHHLAATIQKVARTFGNRVNIVLMGVWYKHTIVWFVHTL